MQARKKKAPQSMFLLTALSASATKVAMGLARSTRGQAARATRAMEVHWNICAHVNISSAFEQAAPTRAMEVHLSKGVMALFFLECACPLCYNVLPRCLF